MLCLRRCGSPGCEPADRKDTTEAKVDLITGGFTLDGGLDPTFGTNGTVRSDVAGEDDRGRHVVGLPSGGALLVGSGQPTGNSLDAMVVKLTRGWSTPPRDERPAAVQHRWPQ